MRALAGTPQRIDDVDVAWEWVGPTATAVVGVAGIGFTWWTGAQQRRVQESLTLISLRRDLYTRFLRAGDELLYEAVRLHLARRTADQSNGEPGDRTFHEVYESVRPHVEQLGSLQDEAILIAGNEVAIWIGREGDTLVRDVHELIAGGRMPDEFPSRAMRADLLLAMRRDLHAPKRRLLALMRAPLQTPDWVERYQPRSTPILFSKETSESSNFQP